MSRNLNGQTHEFRKRLELELQRNSISPLPWHDEFFRLLEIYRCLLLIGEKGTGKTTISNVGLTALNQAAPQRIQGSASVEQYHIWGRTVLRGRTSPFIDGPLPISLKTDTSLYVDEFQSIPHSVIADLIPLRQEKQITNVMTNETLDISQNFRCVATALPHTLGCSRTRGIATAVLDGFIVFEIPELSPAQIKARLSVKHPAASEMQLRRCLELFEEYNDFAKNSESHDTSEQSSPLSYRAAENLLLLLMDGGFNETRSVELALLGQFRITDPNLHSAAQLKLGVSSSTSAGDEQSEKSHDDNY